MKHEREVCQVLTSGTAKTRAAAMAKIRAVDIVVFDEVIGDEVDGAEVNVDEELTEVEVTDDDLWRIVDVMNLKSRRNG